MVLNQRLNTIQKCVQHLILRKFPFVQDKILSKLFRNRELIVETLQEMVDAIVEEMLEPISNCLIPKSD